MPSVFLDLDKEAKINLTKIEINELYICPFAKASLFGLVTIILSLSFVLFFLRLSKIKKLNVKKVWRYFDICFKKVLYT